MKISATAVLGVIFGASVANSIPVLAPSTGYHGDMRYFYPSLGSCGHTNTSSQRVVALSAIVMQNGPNPNTNPKCGQIVTIKYKDIIARAEVVDTCFGCVKGDIMASSKTFEKFGPLSQGVVDGVTWHFDI